MTKKRFITGFSGLRALAVIGVILYHLDPNTFVGGYLGVPIFFVLSGYLVTCQILKAQFEQGTFDYRSFYLGRIKKLYPSLIGVLWAASAYILLFQRNLLAKLGQIVVTNLLNVYNFWQIANGQSYFERFATNESPFVHLWTMSISGQFYILWPLIIYLLVKFGKKKKNIFFIIFGMTALSALEMALLYHNGVDINRIYYGTDTRFFALGLGAALAVIWPMDKLRTTVKKVDANLLDLVGLVSLLVMILLFFSPYMNPEKAFPYEGGMLLFSFFTAVLVGIVAHPCSRWNKWLTNPFFQWFGSRSYGIYLYQFPVMIFFEDKIQNMADHPLLYHLLELIIILVLSEASYRLIEKPFGAITWVKTKNFLQGFLKVSKQNIGKRLLTVVAGLLFIVGSCAIIVSPTVKAKNYNNSPLAQRITANQKKQQKENKALINKLKKDKQKAEERAKLVSEAKRAAKVNPVNKEYRKYDISQVNLQLADRVHLTAIGDSVMAGSSNDLSILMPKAIIDAAVSRQLPAAYQLVSYYKSQRALADNVLIALGSNGPFGMSDLKDLMTEIGKKRQVFWINVHIPNKPWQNQVNQLVKEASEQYHNFTVIDWYNYSKGHPDWFYEDQTHPTPLGSKYYSAYIVKMVTEHAKF